MPASPKTVSQRAPEPGAIALTSYVDVYRAAPLVRIGMIKGGIPAAQAKRVFSELSIAQGAAFGALNLSAATVNRKAARDGRLSSDESERVVGMAKLIGQLQTIVAESGDPEGFDAVAWMSRWLQEPLPALGGNRPVDLLDTMEGQALVGGAIAKLQSAAYA
jgi:putative toxin-antitoxin system antitoxin component (TIGR02293 family)